MKSNYRRFGMTGFYARLMLGTACSAIALGSALAQNAQSVPETVVVTGTAIRNAQPVGSDLITFDRADIESSAAQNTQQLLSDIPQINVFGGSGQGGSNSDFTGGFAPAIHSIGGGSSSATLVLIDGHRFPTQGLTEAQSDPTIVPASMLQRVEVLPDGASSIYGSDAVAGVINFVTRKNFNGVEIGVQGGVADSYNTTTVNVLTGYQWTGGGIEVGYDYDDQSNLMNRDRSFITARQDIRRGTADPSLFTGVPASPPAGSMTTTPAAGPGTTGPYGVAIPYPSTGFNFQNFFCPVATIASTSNSSAFYYQDGGYGGPSFSTSTTNQPSQGACDQLSEATNLPSTTRNSGMVQLHQSITENLLFDFELVYGSRASTAQSSRGTANAQVFGPTSANTSQINPFYVGNATTGTSTEFVRYDFNALLGPGAYTKTYDSNFFISPSLTWDMGNDREITLMGVAGSNFNYQHISGVVDSGEALMALNGTTNTNGSLVSPSQSDVFGLGSIYGATRALNVNNALDVWDPAGPTNRTPPQVIAALKDGGSFSNAQQSLEDLVAKFDGPVFDLGAGPVKVALGGEFTHSTMDEYGTTVNAAGPALSNSNAYYYREGRRVYAAFLELNAPLVSPEMNVPLVQRFSVDASGRIDDYNVFGTTKNPKVAFDWTIVDGVKGRGSFGTSFVAPTIHDAQAFNSQSQINALTAQLSNPIIAFNSTLPYNGGAGIAGTWVSTPASCAQGGGVVVNSAGSTVTGPGFTGAVGCKVNFAATSGATSSAAITVPGANPNLKPATGRSWEGGFDIDAGKLIDSLSGLLVSVTYWDVAYHGLITNQQTQNNIPQLTFFAPIGGWTPQSAFIQNFISGRPVTIALQPTIWATFDGRLQNAFNLWENGIDFNVNYTVPTASIGVFRFGVNGTELLRYSQQGGAVNPILDTKDGKNAPRYNSQDLIFRATMGWLLDNWNAQLAMNYIHPELVTDSNFPYNLPGPGRGALIGSPPVFTSAGEAHLGASVTVDLSAGYTIPKGLFGLPESATDGASLSLAVQNLLDTDPPFNPATSNGFTVGSPIGRLVTVGLKKVF